MTNVTGRKNSGFKCYYKMRKTETNELKYSIQTGRKKSAKCKEEELS